ncbi:MAG: GNAT family N-acetyltransferase [Flavobacteriaceae bacterium]|nr:GNAT family N-acetyltransferase [Flavobacteriaceae bacterium]
MEKISWNNKLWNELSREEIEELFILRAKVFVVEQNCAYLDIDYHDQKAIHILGRINNKIITYSRAFNDGDFYKEASFGRALVVKKMRGKGFGNQLITETLRVMEEKWKNKKIKISAQAHLSLFYQNHGFKPKGEQYLEDGIPHVAMYKN